MNPHPTSLTGIPPARSNEDLAEEAMGRLRILLEGDAEALAVVELSLAGVDKPAEQAARLNIPVSRVYDARDRVGRCVRHIGRELATKQEEEEAAQ